MPPRKTVIVILVLAIVLVGAFLLYHQKSAVYAGLNSLKLIPQPEQFTELYFENSSALPRATVAKQPISFSFGIHNVEGTSTVYPYEVYFEYPDGSKVNLAAGTVTLPSDASTTISVSHTFSSSNLTGEVVVNLPSLDNQQIDFLVPDNN